MNLSWTVHPFKRDYKKSAFLLTFILLIALLVYFQFNSLAFMMLAIVLLVLTMRQYFWANHYTLDDDGVKVRTITGQTKRPWSYFKSYYNDGNGVLLSPFEGKDFKESFRGIYLILPERNKQEILDAIQQHISIAQTSK